MRDSLLQCPSCVRPFLTEQSVSKINDADSKKWTDQLYPARREVSFRVPESLRKIFREAIGCAESGYLVAAAMMCRRTLEGICNHYIPDLNNLGVGLDDLHKAKIIDDRLFEWAEALRKDGNLAAHGGDPALSEQDVDDLVEFTEAILDYVFVLRERFEVYRVRRKKP
jgi:Domain of unknown function (DUF4145)